MDDRKLPFMAHLQELRIRLRNSIIAFIIAVLITYNFAKAIAALLAAPLVQAMVRRGISTADLNYGSLVDPFWVYLEVAMWAALFLSSPIIFHQLWAFIAPGLYKSEKRIALPFAGFSALFFCGGALFCYFVVMPAAFNFFLSYSDKNIGHLTIPFTNFDVQITKAPLEVKQVLMLDRYLALATKLLLGFGIMFELPLLIFFLSWIGLVTHRSLIKFNKYAIVLAFILGAVLTPGGDIGLQLFMAVPLVVLYNASIVVAWVVTKRREREEAATMG